MAKNHEKYMQRCFELAKKGFGNTYPNPMVGSVIVYNDKIIGEGYHHKCGEVHAEVNAVNSVKDKSLLSKSTIYVSLEPCSHVGRTPACSTMIINEKIPHIVVACTDSFDKVSGKGIEMLKNANRKVELGILEKEARELNKRFFTFHEKKRPYIILKWAQTSDGFIDLQRDKNSPIQPNWITGESERMLVHKWRAEEQAIMVGTNTAEKDNPKLNVRDWSGESPLRIVLDRNLRLSKELSLFDGTQKNIVFTEKSSENGKNLEFVNIKFDKNLLKNIFSELHKREIQSIIIEGGAMLLQSLIDENLWDEARVFIGDKLFLKGINAPKISTQVKNITNFENSKLYFYRNFI